jgi:peptidoglycan/xylan/chitin deacetylase (PgdA/CDA1 family)
MATINQFIKKYCKSLLYRATYYTGIDEALSGSWAKTRKLGACIILVYHRIVDDTTLYLDKGPVVHHHIKHFKQEIPFLAKTFRIASMDEVVERIVSGKGFEEPTISITFDDGYLDNYTLAYPVLKAYGVPATIYLATALIGTGGRTWPDMIEAALISTKKTSISMPSLFEGQTLSIRSKDEKRNVSIEFAKSLKKMPDAERKKRLPEFYQALDVDEETLSSSEKRTMLNWDEVREMAAGGISFGSHSHSHPILSRVPLLLAKEDILTSKKVMEERLGIPTKHFAYPNGREEDFSDELREYCREIGFESVATVVYGTNDSRSDPFSLKRVGAVSPVWMMAGDLMRYCILLTGRRPHSA